MSDTAETTVPVSETSKQDPSVQEAINVVNAAISALMDVSNLLRDLPKLVAVNQQLVGRLREAGLLGDQPKA